MDPVSAIAFGVTAFEVLECVKKILNFLLKLSTKFRYTNVTVQLVIGFLSSLKLSIAEVKNIVDGLANHDQYKDVVDGLTTTIECTKFAMAILESKLDGLRPDSTNMRAKIEKLMVVLEGDEFGEWSSDIGHLVDALNLSLNALQRSGILNARSDPIVTDKIQSLFARTAGHSIQSGSTGDYTCCRG